MFGQQLENPELNLEERNEITQRLLSCKLDVAIASLSSLQAYYTHQIIALEDEPSNPENTRQIQAIYQDKSRLSNERMEMYSGNHAVIGKIIYEYGPINKKHHEEWKESYDKERDDISEGPSSVLVG